MIATRELPETFRLWNRTNQAPHGRMRRTPLRLIKHLSLAQRSRLRGMYGIQGNSGTRTYEYPWAWHAAKLERGMDVLEIGGGLAGFQFSLSRHGCRVTNVDPGMDEQAWPCSPEAMATLNKVFGTDVRLVNADIATVDLAPQSFDRVFSVSVMEHLEQSVRDAAMAKVYECLRPGGLAIFTVDLFLDLSPFTTRTANQYGTNCNIRNLIGAAPFRLVAGSEEELFGFDSFSADRIQSNLSTLFMGDYPVMAQCFVLAKD